MMHQQIFEMCYYGNGFIQSDLYKLPTHIRNFYYKQLVKAKKKEKEETKKTNSASNSKVRIRK